MSKLQTLGQQIIEEVAAWPGVTVGTGEIGETAFKFGHREIGHMHGGRAAHFAFPKRVWAELIEQGRIGPHPYVRKPGLGARAIRDETDVREVVALLRLNYERMAGAPATDLPAPESRPHAPATSAPGPGPALPAPAPRSAPGAPPSSP